MFKFIRQTIYVLKLLDMRIQNLSSGSLAKQETLYQKLGLYGSAWNRICYFVLFWNTVLVYCANGTSAVST